MNIWTDIMSKYSYWCNNNNFAAILSFCIVLEIFIVLYFEFKVATNFNWHIVE